MNTSSDSPYQIKREGTFYILLDTLADQVLDIDEDRQALVMLRNNLNTAHELKLAGV